MTTIIQTADGPCYVRTITIGSHTFVCREHPNSIQRFRNAIEYREPVRAQKRVAGGRFGSVVVS